MNSAFFPLPSLAVAVIVASPTAIPLTLPAATVATSALDVDHSNSLFAAFSGPTVAVKVNSSPITISAFPLAKAISFTDTGTTVTFTSALALSSFPLIVIVIVALPTSTAVSFPPSTVTTLSSDVAQ